MIGRRLGVLSRWIRVCLMIPLASVVSSGKGLAQNWSLDARTIGLGDVGGSGNLATKMIDEQRDYRSIVLPFGLIQTLQHKHVFDPGSSEFDPIRAIEYASSPFHYVFGRDTGNSSAESRFVSGVRNATLGRKLSTYPGFVPANDVIAEGLVSPSFGGTIKVRQDPMGGFQGMYVGAGPYLSLRTAAAIDRGLTNVLTTGIDAPSALLPMTASHEGQLALAVTGGYRGRFRWPSGVGSGSAREGLYVAANYNYLHGFQYENDDIAVRFITDNQGSLVDASNIAVGHRHTSAGSGMALDFGIGAVIDHWEAGFGARGIANRIDWSKVEATTYSLSNLTSGRSTFTNTPAVAAADRRVELPVDYRGNVAYYSDRWTAAVEVGHGLGGGSFHGGLERRFRQIELRGGARYTVGEWNPAAGIGFNLTRRVSLDVAAFGTTANIERQRRMAVAGSLRLNHDRK